MEPQKIVRSLEAAGLTQIEIARRLTSSGESVSQSTINRIATGETTNTSYRVGSALAQLLASVQPPQVRSRRTA